MNNKLLFENFKHRDISITLDKVLDNSKASSGGDRDLNFLNYLIDNSILDLSEFSIKRSDPAIVEEYYLDRYKKMSYESDRHFLCRGVIQEELKRKGIKTIVGLGMGNMEILRENSVYDIVTEDFSLIIDIGLTPARNFFRGLTDLKTYCFLLTSYFDDYMDDIIFSAFNRKNDDEFINAVKDYTDGYKLYKPEHKPTNELMANEEALRWNGLW